MRAKTKKALNIIKVIAGKKCGADHRTLKRLYSAVCRSIQGNKKISIIYTEKYKLYTGTFRMSPVESLHIKEYDPTMELERNKLGLRFRSDHNKTTLYRIIPNHQEDNKL